MDVVIESKCVEKKLDGSNPYRTSIDIPHTNIKRMLIETKRLQDIVDLRLEIGGSGIIQLRGENLSKLAASKDELCDFTSEYIEYIPATLFPFHTMNISIHFSDEYVDKQDKRVCPSEIRHKTTNVIGECEYNECLCCENCKCSDFCPCSNCNTCTNQSHFESVSLFSFDILTPRIVCEKYNDVVPTHDATGEAFVLNIRQPVLLKEISWVNETGRGTERLIKHDNGITGYVVNVFVCVKGMGGLRYDFPSIIGLYE